MIGTAGSKHEPSPFKCAGVFQYDGLVAMERTVSTDASAKPISKETRHHAYCQALFEDPI